MRSFGLFGEYTGAGGWVGGWVGGLGGFGVLGWVGTETNIYKESTKESTLHVGTF